MKRMMALLLALILSLTLVCPTFAAEEKKLVVLGDSISHGTGLYEGEVPYGDLLCPQYFDHVVNIAEDGNECDDVLVSIARNSNVVSSAACFALSVGSNDYVEYLADNICGITEPEDFAIPYSDMTEFFADILMNETSQMRQGFLNFLNADSDKRTAWKNGFCESLETNLKGVIEELHGYRPDAPILLLNYYSPADMYAATVAKGSLLLNAACRDIQEATCLLNKLYTANAYQRAALLAMVQTKMMQISVDIYSFTPLLKEFGVDITMLNPLVALAGMGLAGWEAMAKNTYISEQLAKIAEMVTALNELVKFTGETLTKMNGVLKGMAKDDELLVIIDVSDLGKSAANVSSIDHFHPSEQGQRIIADKVIAALNARDAGGSGTTPAYRIWFPTPLRVFRWWMSKIF